MKRNELRQLISKAALGCVMAVLALTACFLTSLLHQGEGTVTPAPEPSASVRPTAPPVPTPEPTPVPTDAPTLTGGPEPEVTAPPQEDLSSYGLPKDALVNPYVAYSYEQLCEDIAQLEAKYPGLITSFSIGKSVEGRELTAFTFGRGKREVILCATMHACEYMATNVLMHMVDGYCMGYEADEKYGGMSYREILDNVRFIVVPMLNPDGVNIAQNGPDAAADPAAVRKIGGRDYNYAGWKANANGVDLNGNFKYKWGIRDEVTAPAPEGWAGPSMASEPETQAMIKLMDSVNFYMLVSMHIRGEVLYWLDTDTLDKYNEYYPLAARFAKAFGFELLDPEDVTGRGGYMVNSARIEYGRFCMTVELCPYISVDPYPLGMFDRSSKPVYPLGLIMGDEALKMEELPRSPDVIIGGKLLAPYPQRLFMEKSSVLAPAFEVLSKSGAEWSWRGEPKGILEASYNGNKVSLKLGSSTMTVNGTEVKLDAPLRFTGGTLMMPVCEVLRALRMDVTWDAERLDAVVELPQAAEGSSHVSSHPSGF